MQQRADPSLGSASGAVQALDAIRGRRACRAYLPKPVTEPIIRQLLDLAIAAPSAQNLQPWSFVVIEDRAILQQISREAKAILMHDPHWGHELRMVRDDFDIFYGAPTLIGICSSAQGFCAVGDCYLAGQNLMLAAHAMGLASCPIGFARDVLQSERMRGILQVPDDRRLVLPIVIGHPAKQMPLTQRRPPLIHAWLKHITESAS